MLINVENSLKPFINNLILTLIKKCVNKAKNGHHNMLRRLIFHTTIFAKKTKIVSRETIFAAKDCSTSTASIYNQMYLMRMLVTALWYNGFSLPHFSSHTTTVFDVALHRRHVDSYLHYKVLLCSNCT